MTRKRKGFGDMIIALTLIFILIFVWTPTGILKGETSDSYITIVREDDVNTVQNSLDLAYTFIENSLDYAVYQAVKDAPPLADGQDIAKPILDNLNRYTESGGKIITCMGKKIMLPEFKKVTIIPYGVYMKIIAETDKNIHYETQLSESDSLYQEKNATLNSVYSFSIFRMKEEAQKVFDSIKSNSCDNRKYNDKCGRYNCRAESSMSDVCQTTIKVEYTESTYPVLEGGEAVFKNLGLTFVFG